MDKNTMIQIQKNLKRMKRTTKTLRKQLNKLKTDVERKKGRRSPEKQEPPDVVQMENCVEMLDTDTDQMMKSFHVDNTIVGSGRRPALEYETSVGRDTTSVPNNQEINLRTIPIQEMGGDQVHTKAVISASAKERVPVTINTTTVDDIIEERIPLCTVDKTKKKFIIWNVNLTDVFHEKEDEDVVVISVAGYSAQQRPLLTTGLFKSLCEHATAVEFRIPHIKQNQDNKAPGIYLLRKMFRMNDRQRKVTILLVDVVDELDEEIPPEMMKLVSDMFFNCGQILLYNVYRRFDQRHGNLLNERISRNDGCSFKQSLYVIITSWVDNTFGVDKTYLQRFIEQQATGSNLTKDTTDFNYGYAFKLPKLFENSENAYLDDLVDNLLEISESHAISVPELKDQIRRSISVAENWNTKKEKSKEETTSSRCVIL